MGEKMVQFLFVLIGDPSVLSATFGRGGGVYVRNVFFENPCCASSRPLKRAGGLS